MSSIGPDVFIRLSLSSILALILDTAFACENMFKGSNEASPYLAFF